MPQRPPMHQPFGVKTGKAATQQRDRWRGSASSRGYDRDWQKVRLQVLAAEPLCRFCHERDLVTAAEVVDHIHPITERPDLRLDWSNLRPLCKPCHDRHTGLGSGRNPGSVGTAHPDWLQPSAVPLTIVCGPPLSGKSSYVAANAEPGDEVIELDTIASGMAGSSLHTWSRDYLGAALWQRNHRLGQLKSARCRAAWFIVGEPKPEGREWWCRALQPTQVVVIETAAEECMRRLRADEERQPRRTSIEDAIGDWWRLYQRRGGDTIVRQGQEAR